MSVELVTQDSTLRNRFSNEDLIPEISDVEEKTTFNTEQKQQDEKTELSEQEETEVEESEETQEETQEEREEEDDFLVIPSETESEPHDEQTVEPVEPVENVENKIIVHEDSTGREYVVIDGIAFYRESEQWNMPVAVRVSFGLIMFINFLNTIFAISSMVSCPKY